MLFKYADVDDNAPKSTASPAIPVSLKLIDFQMSRIGHPLTDILYFLNASAKPEVREQHMEKLLRLYYDTLTADLQQLDIPLDHYTFQDFLDDYKKRSLMGLFFGGLIMSMGLAKAVVSTMQKLDEEEQLKEPISVTSNRGEFLKFYEWMPIKIIIVFNFFSYECTTRRFQWEEFVVRGDYQEHDVITQVER